LAWKRVCDELSKGVLGGDYDRTEKSGVLTKVSDAEDDARDEVWAGYRYVLLSDHREPDGLKVIDLGAGHASSGDSLCGRILAALKSEGLLNDSVGAGYLERNWPPALKESGTWPLTSLRKSFLDGSLTRLPDPDVVLRKKIVEFVGKGDFGYASGQAGSGFERLWFQEELSPDEVAFEPDVFLLTKTKAQTLKAKPVVGPEPLVPSTTTISQQTTDPDRRTARLPTQTASPTPPVVPKATPTFRLVGQIPSEVWNRLGTKLLTKLKAGEDLKIDVTFTVGVKSEVATTFEAEIRQVLDDLSLTDKVRIERD
jgi:hypothetical protein